MKGLKVAIFCDSEFFHGKDWDLQKKRIKTNSEFWINKIEKNITRDIRVNEKLKSEGWTVIRFWGNQIKKDLDSCLEVILDCIAQKKQDKK